ncbi:hypothetical protein CB018_19410 [Salmonella enterica]|nr:hypothetical protein [Salmonella enterica]
MTHATKAMALIAVFAGAASVHKGAEATVAYYYLEPGGSANIAYGQGPAPSVVLSGRYVSTSEVLTPNTVGGSQDKQLTIYYCYGTFDATVDLGNPMKWIRSEIKEDDCSYVVVQLDHPDRATEVDATKAEALIEAKVGITPWRTYGGLQEAFKKGVQPMGRPPHNVADSIFPHGDFGAVWVGGSGLEVPDRAPGTVSSIKIDLGESGWGWVQEDGFWTQYTFKTNKITLGVNLGDQ